MDLTHSHSRDSAARQPRGAEAPVRRRLRRTLLWIGAVPAGILAGLFLMALYHTRDRHPGPVPELALTPPAATARAGVFRAGFGRAKITPAVVDTWVDADDNARYQPDKGDRYEDRNGNGRFDAFWIAGFHNARPAQGVHDDLWAVAAVVDDGSHRLAIVALDAIGFMHDDVLDVRARLPKAWRVDHAIICATHSHEVPDLLGLWGESHLKSGVDREYLSFVKTQAVAAIGAAVSSLRPARMRLGELPPLQEGVARDTRRPIVFDAGVRVMQFLEGRGGGTIGTLVTWSDHPETLWSHNLQITADFCGYLREGVEQGIRDGGRVHRPGVGGTCLYVNGAIGGLITTPPGLEVEPPFPGEKLKGATFEKARAVGYRVADAVLQELARGSETESAPKLEIRTRVLSAPMDNMLYKLAAGVGLIKRGFTGGAKVRTEVNLVKLGGAWIVTVPGEIYPEIVNGGIENPEGADYRIAPVEVPPIRSMMRGKVNFVLGLANDEIGYIIPKSEWDTERNPPYLYGADRAPYGEENSLGPETGPIIHGAIRDLLRPAKPRTR